MKLIKVLKITCLIMILNSIAHAEVLPNLNQYFKDMESNELKETIGYETTDVKGKDMPLDQAESLGISHRENKSKDDNYECTKGDCNVSHTFSSEATVNRQENTEEAGFTKDKDGVVRNNKGFLDKALKTVKNADKEFDFLNGSYASCTPLDETVITKSEESCDQYYNMETNGCMPRQVVEIDPKYNYVCNKKREVKEKVCTDVIKSIKCRDSKECDMGGIEPSSVASDMTFTYSNGVLLIGTIGDNYWPGNCTVYDRDTEFTIKNKQLLKEFRLMQVGFDDHIQVKVNGYVVYVGPYGGNKLELINYNWGSTVTNGAGEHNCELGTNWVQDTSVDLRPYLYEGRNKISIRVVVSGVGEGWIKIAAKQHCCKDFDIQREEKCEYR